jgi:hypothetical protein
MLGPFMYIFFILPVEVGSGVGTYFLNKGVWVCMTDEEEFFRETENEIADGF